MTLIFPWYERTCLTTAHFYCNSKSWIETISVLTFWHSFIREWNKNIFSWKADTFYHVALPSRSLATVQYIDIAMFSHALNTIQNLFCIHLTLYRTRYVSRQFTTCTVSWILIILYFHGDTNSLILLWSVTNAILTLIDFQC